MKLNLYFSIALAVAFILTGEGAKAAGDDAETAQGGSYKSSVLLANGKGALEFERLSGKNGRRRLTLTRPGEKEVVVWESRLDPYSTIYEPSQDDQYPYVGAKLMGADLKDGVLLVLLRLDSKNNGLFGVEPNLRDKYTEYRKEWDGCDYLLRSFVVQQDGTWEVYISAYPKTFWPDVLNVEAAGVAITDRNSYVIRYKGTVETFGSLATRDIYQSNQYKVVHPQGFTEKRLAYDEQDRLLYSLGEVDADRMYIDGSVWWQGFDEFSRSNSVPTNHHVVMKTHEERCKELKVVPKLFRYLQKVTEEDLERRRKRVNPDSSGADANLVREFEISSLKDQLVKNGYTCTPDGLFVANGKTLAEVKDVIGYDFTGGRETSGVGNLPDGTSQIILQTRYVRAVFESTTFVRTLITVTVRIFKTSDEELKPLDGSQMIKRATTTP